MEKKKRFLTGLQPSGQIHIGNYFGAIKPAIERQEEGEAFYFIADYHSLTSRDSKTSAEKFKKRTTDLAIDFLACGLDPKKTIFFRQSDVPEVLELYWILSCTCPKGLLERSHSFKDKVAKGISPSHGLFSYPLLMASDILLYGATHIPVGKDQKQHLEITRDIAKKLNEYVGEEILIIPEPIIAEISKNRKAEIKRLTGEILGTDGQKMSKSYNNTIPVFGEEKAMRKLFMKIETDSSPVKEPKPTEKSPLLKFYRLFSNDEEYEAMKFSFEKGGTGYGEYKEQVFNAYLKFFEKMRKKREELQKNPQEIEAILNQGKEKAKERAKQTLQKIRKKLGLPLTYS